MTFSEKYGFKSKRATIQIESIDAPLRNGLWNKLYDNYFLLLGHKQYLTDLGISYRIFIEQIWGDFYKFTVDAIPFACDEVLKYIKTIFYDSKWYEVYDFLEFCVRTHDDNRLNKEFMEESNRILERELSAYRFVGNEITPITSPTEIAEIEKATSTDDPSTTHLKTALKLLSNRESPDYRNSIKESISAVESLCGTIADKPKATLGDALGAIKKSGVIELHPALNSAFDKLYGYTSDANGIRHALLDEPDELRQEDAIFMLVACSAFVNYLKVKQSRIKT